MRERPRLSCCSAQWPVPLPDPFPGLLPFTLTIAFPLRPSPPSVTPRRAVCQWCFGAVSVRGCVGACLQLGTGTRRLADRRPHFSPLPSADAAAAALLTSRSLAHSQSDLPPPAQARLRPLSSFLLTPLQTALLLPSLPPPSPDPASRTAGRASPSALPASLAPICRNRVSIWAHCALSPG